MAPATATAQRTKSGYAFDKADYVRARELRDLQFAERQRARATQAPKKDNVIHAENRFGGEKSSQGSLLAHERKEESGFGKEEPDVSNLQGQDLSPLERTAAEGGLYQPGAREPTKTAPQGETPEEPTGREGQGGAPEGAIAADQDAQKAARDLRAEKLKSKQEGKAQGISIPGASADGEQGPEQALVAAQQLATNTQRVSTFFAAGSLSFDVAFLDLGIMTAAAWTGMGLVSFFKPKSTNPLSKFIDRFGLPDPARAWAIPVVLFDILVILLLCAAFVIIYYVLHPLEAANDLLLKPLLTSWFGITFD